MTNGKNSSGASGSRAGIQRDGVAETVNLSLKFRDHFDEYIRVAQSARGADPAHRASILRNLQEQLIATAPLIPSVIDLLGAEVIEALRGGRR